MAPRVTVLMTVYNGMPYLEQAVESVLSQTFHDYEFVIIDDASTDGSADCLQRYRDARIRFWRNERNRGQAWSLNEGLARSSAPLVARLDQDDVCLPDRLRQQVAVFDQRPDVAVVGTWLYSIGTDSRKQGLVGMRIDDYGAFLGALLTSATPVVHPTVMFRRDAVAGVGGYDKSFAPCEDYALWCRLALRRQSIVTIQRPLMMVRIHEGQQSHTRTALQQHHARRAHEGLVAACCGSEHAGVVSSLLRMDDAFWHRCSSPAQVRAALQALDDTLAGTQRRFGMSAGEATHLRERISWWLGRGAFIAILRQQRHSRAVVGWAWRQDRRALRYPAMLLYPACFLFSPLFVPRLRRACVSFVTALGRQKSIARLLLNEIRALSHLRIAKLMPRRLVKGGRVEVETLYISYDGMLEPLGSSQVVSYLERLSGAHTITLLSYEKPRDLHDHARLRALADRLQGRGIRWIRLRYHKRLSLLATGFDVLQGLAVGMLVCWRRRVTLIHARGYVSSVMALCLKRLWGAKFVFDMRGFWADEKADAGHWSRTSLAYRLAKRWERRFFEQSDAIVSLTAAGVNAFPRFGYQIPQATPIVVIPTCADLERFSPGPKDPELIRRFGLDGATIVGCVGTLSNWYLRTPTLRGLAVLARRLARAKIVFVTREDHACLRDEARAAGIPLERMVLTQVDFDAMPAYLRLMDLGVFFIQPSSSKQGSCATKLGEFLATGIPVLINDGVGDSGAIVRDHRAGVVLSGVEGSDVEASVDEVERLLCDPLTRHRCLEAAQQGFDLREGVKRYAGLYASLAAPVPVTRVVVDAVGRPRDSHVSR